MSLFPINPANHGTLTGRLVQDPEFTPNKDGSLKIRITLAVKRSYEMSPGTPSRERPTDFIRLDAYLSKSEIAESQFDVYSHIHKGDLVQVLFTVRVDSYKGQNGKPMTWLSLFIKHLTLLDVAGQKNYSAPRQNDKVPQNVQPAVQANPTEPEPFELPPVQDFSDDDDILPYM